MVKVLRCKVLLLGGASVGKSALLAAFHSEGGAFPKAYAMTSGAEFVVKTVAVPDADAVVELYVFDVGGQDIYRELARQYMVGANAIVLAYDVTRPETLREALPTWAEAAAVAVPRGQLQGVVAACKCDLETRAAVPQAEGEAFAKHHNLDFFQTSAKENKNVDAVFQAIARGFVATYEEALASFGH